MQVDAENLDLDLLHQQLDVQFVVHGSVQMSGEKLRITVQMPNTRTHEIVWARKWNSTIDEFFDVQDAIAEGVVDALEIQLNPSQKERLTERPIPNMQAYEYYLRARHLIYQYTGEALNKALDYLRLGADIVGDNALITAAIGYVYWQFNNAGIDPDPRHLHESRKCADKLLALDPDSPEGHRLMGLLNAHEKGSIQMSVGHLKLALKANPNDTDTLFWLPLLYSFVGRVSSGQALAEKLLALDPLTAFLQILPGFLYMMDGDLPRGRTYLLKSHETNPGNPITTLAYGQILAMNGRRQEAEPVFASLEDFVPDSFFSQLGKFYIHALHGDKRTALSAATTVLTEGAGSDLQYSWSMAQCFALIDEYDSAIEWLENAVEYGFWNYPLLSERDPLLEPLREHERFRALMVDVKKKWIEFEV
jgi:non-specific serine/threonine protein kinase